MVQNNIIKAISALLCFAVLFSSSMVYAGANTQPDAKGDTITVNSLFAFFRSEPNLLFNTIKGIFWNDREVKVLGYSGSYVYVQDLKTNDKGYIHELLLKDKPLNIKQQYVDVFSGALREGILTINYDKDGMLEWSVSQSGIVEVTKHSNRSLSIKGINPGTVTLTVKCNGDKDTCDISCIDKWADKETAKAESSIKVMGTPGKYYDGAKTIPEGATITAHGHIPSNNEYIYVSSGDIWGFINLSNFSKINYFLTEYHYYDNGYKIRFPNVNNKTPSESIYSYTSVLNNLMIKLFKLKVCSYVNEYTSLADTCKTLSYGEVNKNNISKACPRTESHNVNSCLERGVLWDKFKTDVGHGNNTTIKLLWTGHILPNHQVSAAQNGSESIIMTTANTVFHNKSTNTYSNKSDAEIRKNSLYTLTHETGHLLGTIDGYCKHDNSSGHCSNENCYSCNGKPEPICIMVQLFSPEESNVVFCDECTKIINEHLKDHH